MRDGFLSFALPDMDGSELSEISEALASGWITTGPKTREFEAKFGRAVGAKHAVAVNSCTAAMHLALEALGLQRGDIVLTTPYAFAASAEVVRYFDAIPVFVDIDPDTFNIDVKQLAEAASALRGDDWSAKQKWLPPSLMSYNSAIRNPHPAGEASGPEAQSVIGRPKAVLPVHIAGLPAELDPIYSIAQKHNLAVVEDAAHAFPAKYRGHPIGSPIAQSLDSLRGVGPSGPQTSIPQLTCFSFYATKSITTGEGGMITTDEAALADRCRVMALHGISKGAWKRHTSEGSWYYEIVAPGYKYNMSDVTAAMGLAQLAKAERMWQRRRDIAHRYNEAFGEVPELHIPADNEDCQHAWHLYMLRLNPDQLDIDRAQFIEELRKLNIGTSVHFIPMHLHPYYRETYGYRPEDFPVAYREYAREISLPVYSRMTDQDTRDVIDTVLRVVRQHGR